jgi:hypothetical protein
VLHIKPPDLKTHRYSSPALQLPPRGQFPDSGHVTVTKWPHHDLTTGSSNTPPSLKRSKGCCLPCKRFWLTKYTPGLLWTYANNIAEHAHNTAMQLNTQQRTPPRAAIRQRCNVAKLHENWSSNTPLHVMFHITLSVGIGCEPTTPRRTATLSQPENASKTTLSRTALRTTYQCCNTQQCCCPAHNWASCDDPPDESFRQDCDVLATPCETNVSTYPRFYTLACPTLE